MPIDLEDAPSSATPAPPPEQSAWDWVDFRGQDRMKAQLEVAITAAINEGRPLGHVFLYGPPGAGKTSIAKIIAGRLGDPLLHFTAPLRPLMVAHELRRFDGGVLFIDEIHRCSTSQQEDLLTLLEGGVYTGGTRPVEHDWLTVIAATTEREKVVQPLLDRFQIQPTWDPYTDDEMLDIVQQIGQRYDLEVPDDDAAVLGRAAAGVPRTAKQLVLNYRDLIAAGREPSAAAVLELARIDTDGLTHAHLEYLKVLYGCGGAAGLSTIGNMLRCSEPMLRDLERLLVQQGLITYEAKGRELTNAGQAKVAVVRKPIRRRPVEA